MSLVLRALVGVTAAVGIVALLALQPAGSASAHPLGNFTVNHYTRIDVSDTGIVVYRVLDMAEIPTLQTRQRIDTNDDGAIDEAESTAFATTEAAAMGDALALSVRGEELELEAIATDLTFPVGQGGLSLLRLAVTYRAALPDGWRDAPAPVEFTDSYQLERIGWREVIVRGGPGIELESSTVPSADLSSELTAYPEDSLSSPLDVRSASFAFRPGAGAALPAVHPRQDDAVRGNPDGALAGFTDLLAKDDLGAGVIAVALLAAVAFGAYHALTPGHGKTVVAAYLVGSRGTARHALLLGLVVTATHTSSVYLVGFVTLYLSQYILPEDLYPWLSITSGVLILIMGLTLLASRVRSTGLARAAAEVARRRAPRFGLARRRLVLAAQTNGVALPIVLHTHIGAHESTRDAGTHLHSELHAHDGSHEHRDDNPSHSHGFGPAHTHRIPGHDGEPVTLRSLIGLGIFGGMIPCPSAIVVMLGAVALHRLAFGLVLIVAFSLGLAAVLVTIGFALVYARAISDRVPPVRALARRAAGSGLAATAMRFVPVVSATAVVAAGAVITLRALMQQGAL